MRSTKNLIAVLLVLVMLTSVLALPASAAVVPEVPVEPNYTTVRCAYCGSTARVTDSNYGEAYGTTSIGAGGCQYYSGAHTHTRYRDYLYIDCPICGDVSMLYRSYSICDKTGVQV